MLDWLGVTLVSEAASECDRVEAPHCERQALERKGSLTCIMRDHFQSVAQLSLLLLLLLSLFTTNTSINEIGTDDRHR